MLCVTDLHDFGMSIAIAVGRCSGGQLATMLVATISVRIFLQRLIGATKNLGIHSFSNFFVIFGPSGGFIGFFS